MGKTLQDNSGKNSWRALALAVVALASWTATAEAQAPIALPLSIHVEHTDAGPIAQDAYVDYAVELANRWLRPAGVCVFAVARHPLRASDANSGEALARRHAGRSIPVAVVDRIRRPGVGDGAAGWGRSGRQPLVFLSTKTGRPFTLAHEMGHVLEQSHVGDADDVMHRTTPANYERLLPSRLSRGRGRQIAQAARRVQRRLGVHPSAHCSMPRALAPPSTIGSGHPVLTQARRTTPSGTYQGEQFFGVKHGTGTWQSDSGYRYRGEYRLGSRQGWGEERHAGGNRYVGAFDAGDRHGFGVFRYASGGVFRGEYVRNDRQGQGVMTWPNGMVYEGAWVNGAQHGIGRRRDAEGNVYEGPFERGRPEGQGRYQFASGSVYAGDMRRGQFHGQGQMAYQSGAHYRGAFERGLRHGFGQYRSASGNVYEGTYHRGARHGRGTLRRSTGRVERRHYTRGRRNRS